MPRSKNPPPPSATPSAPAVPNRRVKTAVVYLGVGLAVAVVPVVALLVTSPGAPDFQQLVGRWSRSEDGYTLEVQQVSADGRVEARYFNPSPINVARARAEREGESFRLIVEFRDRGYDGST